MTHPSPADLLGYALEDPDASGEVAAHVRDCDACAAEIARLRSGMVVLREHAVHRGAPTPACLDDEAVAALAAGDVSSADRSVLIQHIASCAYCRDRVASVARALAEPAVAREVAAAEGRSGQPRVRTRMLVPVVAAAAAVLVLMVLPRQADEPRPPHRAPTVTAATPAPMLPVGPVAAAETLRWATVAGADRYRVTLFDAAATVVYETQTADTAVALPDSIVLVPGRSYLWKVEARIGWDRWSASKLVEFSIRRDGRPR